MIICEQETMFSLNGIETRKKRKNQIFAKNLINKI